MNSRKDMHRFLLALLFFLASVLGLAASPVSETTSVTRLFKHPAGHGKQILAENNVRTRTVTQSTDSGRSAKRDGSNGTGLLASGTLSLKNSAAPQAPLTATLTRLEATPLYLVLKILLI